MRDKPIIFNDAMIRAILDGRKTQTRREIKPQPFIDQMGNFCWGDGNYGQDERGPRVQAIASPLPWSSTGKVANPYGAPGDLLWVREAWREYDNSAECGCLDHCCCPPTGTPIHRATGDDGESKWRPSIHMPRWASRITLEITDVRVERLEDISEDDAMAEGIPFEGDSPSPRDNFSVLWESIHGAGAWDQNPWVWVIEFRPHLVNIDSYLAERGAA